MKKQKPQKYKKVVYKLESDSKTENIEQDTLESEVEETEEEQGKTNNHKNICLKNQTNSNKKHVKKLKIFDCLNSEQDAKRNRNRNKPL